MTISAKVSNTGKLRTKIIRPAEEKPPFLWLVKHWSRPAIFWGWVAYHAAGLFSKIFKIPTLVTALKVKVFKADGRVINYGVTQYGRLIVDDGAEFIVDAWQNTTELENMKYHALGTSSTAAAISDAALVTELTTQYTPDNTRATGTTAEGATANIFQTVATNTLSGAGATIEEFGLLSQAATGGGVLFERALTGTQTLADGDGLQTTYEVTFNSGG